VGSIGLLSRWLTESVHPERRYGAGLCPQGLVYPRPYAGLVMSLISDRRHPVWRKHYDSRQDDFPANHGHFATGAIRLILISACSSFWRNLIGVYGIALADGRRNSKYSLLGSLRASAPDD